MMNDSKEFFKEKSENKYVVALIVLDKRMPEIPENEVKIRTMSRVWISNTEWGDAVYISGVESLAQIWISEELIDFVKDNDGCDVFIICPYARMEDVKDNKLRKRIKRILRKADGVIYLAQKKNKFSFHLCNGWMIKNSVELIPIYTGRAEDDVKVLELARRYNRGYTGCIYGLE